MLNCGVEECRSSKLDMTSIIDYFRRMRESNFNRFMLTLNAVELSFCLLSITRAAFVQRQISQEEMMNLFLGGKCVDLMPGHWGVRRYLKS
jgi:hypothetical protein